MSYNNATIDEVGLLILNVTEVANYVNKPLSLSAAHNVLKGHTYDRNVFHEQ